MNIIWYDIRMDQNLLNGALKIKEELDDLPEVKELERLNKLLNENEDVMRLAYKKDICATKFEDAIRYFGEDSEEANKAQKALHLAKLELDKNELVVAYNNQYKIVRKIYDKINKEIFEPFN